jgi:hypothetical protein
VLILLPGLLSRHLATRSWPLFLAFLISSYGPGAILAAYGVLNLLLARAFRRIGRTPGSDRQNLMSAIATLRTTYLVTALLLLAGLALSGINLWLRYAGGRF